MLQTPLIKLFVYVAGPPPCQASSSIFVSTGAEPMIRWFARSGTEYVICGHGNLGAAYLLFLKALKVPVLFHSVFQTSPMKMTPSMEGSVVQELTAYESSGVDASLLPSALLPALGIMQENVVFAGLNDIGFVIFVNEATAVKSLVPDFKILAEVEARNVVVAAAAGRSDGGTGSDEGGVEFRCFCPRLGIDEDQVTGSACVNLALIYARLHEKYGTWVQARQQSKAGGEMRFQVPSRLEAKVLLSGQAREIVP